MKKHLLIVTAVIVLVSCKTKNEGSPQNSTGPVLTIQRADTIKTNSGSTIDAGKEWLIDIFKCENTKELCFYIEKEKSLCTDRFMNFLIDANEIYGPSNLTGSEIKIAEKKYRKKWTGIYPLYSEETWLFGRGNDDALNIKKVEINKIASLKYSVYIDYNGDSKTQNEVTLVPYKGSFKIDYCKTKFVD